MNGAKVAGSDEVLGIFEVGTWTVLTRSVVVNAEAGFGVTHNAPDFQLGLSFPIRF